MFLLKAKEQCKMNLKDDALRSNNSGFCGRVAEIVICIYINHFKDMQLS